MEKYFKKGDNVRLINMAHADNETINWIDREKSCPSIGDVFTVQFDCESADEFVVLEELLLSHPQSKFDLVTKSSLDMSPTQLSTIDTFQNKNRSFKEDEREIPLENREI